VIFLDTGFLFALVSKRDAHHLRVVEVFRTFKDVRLIDHGTPEGVLLWRCADCDVTVSIPRDLPMARGVVP
jgi:hypothetical protein